MTADQPLDGKTAIVTGASSGIGRETARALADEGASVVLAARREEKLNELADDLTDHGVETLVVPTDVTDEEAVDSLVERTVEEFGGCDVLVNNAGLERGSAVEDLETADYRAMMDVNVDGTFFATRAALPRLREAGGTLVFIGSFAGQYPRPTSPVYASTKWWLRGFALSVSAAAENIAVTVINPSEVRTEFGENETQTERFAEGEVTEPAEVAEAVAFAVEQERSMVSELDLYRRDKLSGF